MAPRKRKNLSRSWESPSVPLTNPGIAQILGMHPSLSGVDINRHTVFALPAFLRGVDLIASTLGRVPVYTYKRGKDASKVRDEEHAAFNLLTRRPNQWQTPFEFKRELVSSAIWAGNGYAYVARDETTAKPTDLVLLDSEHTWPIIVRSTTDPANVQLRYITEINGQQIPLDYSEVVHLKGLGHEGGGWLGMKLIEVVKESLGLGIATIRYGAVYFKHNCNPSMVIELPEFMKNKEQIEQFRETFGNMHAGINNAHRVAILQGGAKLAKTQVNNEEAQFLQSREMSSVDVANILGLPPHKLGAQIATSYGSLEQENLALLNDTYDRWMVNLEEQLEAKLLTEVEKVRASRFIEFDRARLQQADHKTTADVYVSLVNNGLLLPNDACVELNLPPLPDKFNKPRIPSNVQVQGEDKPAPAAPPVPGQQPGQQPPENGQEDAQQQQPAKDTKRLAALTESVLARFLTRLERAGDKLRVEDHREVLAETLAPLSEDSERLAAQLLEEVAERGLESVDVSKWVEEVLNEQ